MFILERSFDRNVITSEAISVPIKSIRLSISKSTNVSAGIPYLPELLYHFFNENISILGNFAFHLSQPFAELLVLFTEDCPFIQSLTYLLPPEGELKSLK